MIDREQLCKKIMEIYPDIGRCGINLDVRYDEEKKAWVTHLEREGKALETYLDDDEIRACLDGKQCVSLGVHVAELSKNIKDI